MTQSMKQSDKAEQYRAPEIEEEGQNLHRLNFPDGRSVFLIGTAHVSEESVTYVEEIINQHKPDTVCVELDEQRYDRIKNQKKYREIDLIKIIRQKQLAFFIGQFIMASFQKRISDQTGTAPGSEFKRAIELAQEQDAKLVLADRNLGVTLRRAWRKTRFRDKLRLLGSLLAGGDEDLEELDIESMKTSDAINSMVGEFTDELPETKAVLIDERDTHLTHAIQAKMGQTTVAIVGAGHVPGMLEAFKARIPDSEQERINTVPPRGNLGKILPWLIPAFVVGLIIWGFLSGRQETAREAIQYWILANGILTAVGCLIAMAHPLTTIAGFIAAPLTSLNPMIGAGFVTALVQIFLAKPRVSDMEQIQAKTMRFRDWWKNRITKVFLVFVLSSVGSSVGTFVALPLLTKIFSGS